jgi:hypothetical protein
MTTPRNAREALIRDGMSPEGVDRLREDAGDDLLRDALFVIALCEPDETAVIVDPDGPEDAQVWVLATRNPADAAHLRVAALAIENGDPPV